MTHEKTETKHRGPELQRTGTLEDWNSRGLELQRTRTPEDSVLIVRSYQCDAVLTSSSTQPEAELHLLLSVRPSVTHLNQSESLWETTLIKWF